MIFAFVVVVFFFIVVVVVVVAIGRKKGEIIEPLTTTGSTIVCDTRPFHRCDFSNPSIVFKFDRRLDPGFELAIEFDRDPLIYPYRSFPHLSILFSSFLFLFFSFFFFFFTFPLFLFRPDDRIFYSRII